MVFTIIKALLFLIIAPLILTSQGQIECPNGTIFLDEANVCFPIHSAEANRRCDFIRNQQCQGGDMGKLSICRPRQGMCKCRDFEVEKGRTISFNQTCYIRGREETGISCPIDGNCQQYIQGPVICDTSSVRNPSEISQRDLGTCKCLETHFYLSEPCQKNRNSIAIAVTELVFSTTTTTASTTTVSSVVTFPTQPENPESILCPTDDQVRCLDGRTIICRDKVCDGASDCPGGEDEDSRMHCSMAVKPTADASSTNSERHVTTAPKHSHEIIIWTTLLSSVTLIIFVAAFGWYYYRKLRRERRKKSSLKTMLPSQRSLDQIPQNGMNVDSSVRVPLISPLTFKLSENPGSSSREVMQYEIPENQFEIDFEAILGKGNFGIVYRGSVRGKEVAIKTLLPDILDPKSIRNMEAEMRVMSELGTHPNIVRLVGVNTAHVDQGKVYIFTEICPLGGLQAYMRKHKAAFIDNDMENVFPSDTTVLTPCDLYKWSYQVCSGMIYLADRKIIHGDLATRNILLLNKDHVKIADFGLALKMYNYSGYVRRLEQEQLPWKWMAIETLKYEKFSLESDIWSFGILLWEIFTLGEIPYPGRRNCTNKFIQEVEEGVRAEQPAHANKKMYEIMMKCWRLEPETRPTFGQVRTILHTFLDQEYLELDALQEDVLEDEQGYLMPASSDAVPV